jgi:hypothetical protein
MKVNDMGSKELVPRQRRGEEPLGDGDGGDGDGACF